MSTTPETDDYLGRAKDVYDEGGNYAAILALISQAESLARIADALEAMMPVSITTNEVVYAPHDMGGLHRIADSEVRP